MVVLLVPPIFTLTSPKKKGLRKNRNPLIFMVGGTGIEPVTSTV